MRGLSRLAAVSLLIGLAIPWLLVGRDIVNKQDLGLALLPIQTQLNSYVTHNATDEDKIEMLEIEDGKLTEEIAELQRRLGSK